MQFSILLGSFCLPSPAFGNNGNSSQCHGRKEEKRETKRKVAVEERDHRSNGTNYTTYLSGLESERLRK
jgi:hypothetical protein